MNPLTYPIRAVAKLTGISVDTLRAWERRYAVVEPERDERGRVYSEADVERLRLLRQAVERGHSIGRVAPLTVEELRALAARGGGQAANFPRASGPVDLADLIAAVEQFNVERLRRELTRLAVILPPRQLALEVALPLMREVGVAWHEGRFSVAQEHLTTAEVRSLVGSLARLREVPEGAPRVLIATPEGDWHELGALVAALLATGAGLATFYLGSNLPAAELIGAARRIRPKVVVLATTNTGDGGKMVETVSAVARGVPSGIECWVGGAGALAARRELAGTGAFLLETFEEYERALAQIAP